MFLPPAVTMRSFFRSVIRRNPSGSRTPMSPVWNHPVGVDRLRRRLRLSVVAPHDVRPARQDLAVGGDPDLDAGHRPAHRTQPAVLEGVHRDHRRGLREPVALQDRHAGGVEELGDLRRQGRSAADEEGDPAAGAGAQGGEDEAVGHRPLKGERGRDRQPVDRPLGPGLAHAAGPGEQGAARRRPVPHGLEDPAVDLLVQTRHRGHEVRPAVRHVRRHGVDALRVVDHHAGVQHAEMPEHPLEDVRQGQKREAVMARGEAEQAHRGRHVRGDVAMGEHDALGVARGARGVDDRGQVGGAGGLRLGAPPGVAGPRRGSAGFDLRQQRHPGAGQLGVERDHVAQGGEPLA